MDFTVIWNLQHHAVYVLVALYKDNQFYMVTLAPKRALNLDARIMEQAQIALCDTEDVLEDWISRLPPTFRQVPFRTS